MTIFKKNCHKKCAISYSSLNNLNNIEPTFTGASMVLVSKGNSEKGAQVWREISKFDSIKAVA